MSEATVVEAFVSAAVAHGAATDSGDHKRANAAFTRKVRALEKLRECPDRGRSTLEALLAHEDPHVRCSAATYLLPLDEDGATAVLTQLTSEPPFVGFNAKMVLREWKAGRLKVP